MALYQGKVLSERARLPIGTTRLEPPFTSFRASKQPLLFQLERLLDAVQIFDKGLVDLQALLDGGATVEHGAVVAAADELANAGGWHLGVLLGQIHDHLAHLHELALATFCWDTPKCWQTFSRMSSMVSG